MLQYISPSIQFLLAIFVLHEPINAMQLLSFGLIWLSLIIYSADSVVRRRDGDGMSERRSGTDDRGDARLDRLGAAATSFVTHRSRSA